MTGPLCFDVDPEDHKQLGRIIRSARGQAGMSQRQLAERMGIRWGQVGGYENGSRPVSWVRFAQAMKILRARARVSISPIAPESSCSDGSAA